MPYHEKDKLWLYLNKQVEFKTKRFFIEEMIGELDTKEMCSEEKLLQWIMEEVGLFEGKSEKLVSQWVEFIVELPENLKL